MTLASGSSSPAHRPLCTESPVDKDLGVVKERFDEIVFRRLAALSSERTEVVPTAITRLPRLSPPVPRLPHPAVLQRIPSDDVIFNGVDAHRLEGARTNVRVTNAISTPLARNFSSKGSSNADQRSGLQPRPVFRYKRFVKFAVSVFVRTVDIRRQRHMPMLLRISSTERSSLNSTSNRRRGARSLLR